MDRLTLFSSSPQFSSLSRPSTALIFGRAISRWIGWIYIVAWSASFWPQFLENYQRKSVKGVSLDFLALNPLGFLTYAIFNIAFISSASIRAQYRQRNNGQDNLVQWNDVVFAVHATVVSAMTLGQSYIYPRAEGQKISMINRVILALLISITLGCVVVASLSPTTLEWIDVMYELSYVKLFITATKYLPQLVLNIRSKSTKGFAIESIILDFLGGFLSNVQLVLDAGLANSWSGIWGDPVKLGLGLLSMIYDVLLIFQHYVLYRPKHGRGVQDESSESSERRHLLDQEERH